MPHPRGDVGMGKSSVPLFPVTQGRSLAGDKGCQGVPKSVKGSQRVTNPRGMAGMEKSSPIFPSNPRKVAKGAKGSQRIPKGAKGSQRMIKSAKGCQRCPIQGQQCGSAARAPSLSPGTVAAPEGSSQPAGIGPAFFPVLFTVLSPGQ